MAGDHTKEARKLAQQINQIDGLSVELDGAHYKVREDATDRLVVTIAKTPSDHRWRSNTIATLRRNGWTVGSTNGKKSMTEKIEERGGRAGGSIGERQLLLAERLKQLLVVRGTGRLIAHHAFEVDKKARGSKATVSLQAMETAVWEIAKGKRPISSKVLDAVEVVVEECERVGVETMLQMRKLREEEKTEAQQQGNASTATTASAIYPVPEFATRKQRAASRMLVNRMWMAIVRAAMGELDEEEVMQLAEEIARLDLE